jgi:hypothetical protein
MNWCIEKMCKFGSITSAFWFTVTSMCKTLHFAHPSYPGYFIQPAATQREPWDILVLGSQARGTRLLHCVIPIFRGLKMRDVSTSRDQTGSFLSYQILPKSHEIGKKSSGMSGDWEYNLEHNIILNRTNIISAVQPCMKNALLCYYLGDYVDQVVNSLCFFSPVLRFVPPWCFEACESPK